MRARLLILLLIMLAPIMSCAPTNEGLVRVEESSRNRSIEEPTETNHTIELADTTETLPPDPPYPHLPYPDILPVPVNGTIDLFAIANRAEIDPDALRSVRNQGLLISGWYCVDTLGRGRFHPDEMDTWAQDEMARSIGVPLNAVRWLPATMDDERVNYCRYVKWSF